MARTYDPFREFDRLVGQALHTERSATAVPLDLYKSGDHYVLKLDLPGADPGSVEVGVEDRVLTVRARRTVADTEVQWLTRERPTGAYARQLTVGRGLDLDQLEATYADGVLTLTVPVAQEAKPRKITVSHGAPAVEKAVEQAEVVEQGQAGDQEQAVEQGQVVSAN